MNNFGNEIQVIGLVCNILLDTIHSCKFIEFMLQGGLKEQANIWLNLETRERLLTTVPLVIGKCNLKLQ